MMIGSQNLAAQIGQVAANALAALDGVGARTPAHGALGHLRDPTFPAAATPCSASPNSAAPDS
jgi:hypothetical protein